MKKVGVIFIIYLTVVLEAETLKLYNIMDFLVNETCATTYPIIKEEIKDSDFKRNVARTACGLACIWQEAAWIEVNGTLLETDTIENFTDAKYARCMKEMDDCKRSDCLFLATAYDTLNFDNSQFRTCVLNWNPGNTLEFVSCGRACRWEYYGFFKDGKIPKNYTIPELPNIFNYITSKKVLEDSYEACKTVNSTCARVYCMEQGMKKIAAYKHIISKLFKN